MLHVSWGLSQQVFPDVYWVWEEGTQGLQSSSLSNLKDAINQNREGCK